MMLHAVIMAGGGGTRFWPRSRQKRPKQFLTLAGEHTLLQQAFDRVEPLATGERTWIITGESYREETAHQLPHVPASNIVGEPCGRDTAACIGLGAALVARQDADAVMLVTPADHIIEPAREFGRAAQAAERITEEFPKAIVTFGIRPTHPATGYGYIHRGPLVGNRQGVNVFRVQRFREKPDARTAEDLLKSGEYFWNSGIFVWKATTILDYLKELRPTLYAAISRIADSWTTPQREAVLKKEYESLERISIDYAVMEHAKEVFVVEAPFQWDDVGSWLALERLHPQDADGNTIMGGHCGVDTKNCVIAGENGKLIATVGVENLIIIQDGDAILVADRRHEGDIKKIVELLKKKGLERYT